MKLSYTLTLADYIAATRLHRMQTLGRRLTFALLYFGLPILAVAGMIIIILSKMSGRLELAPSFLFAEAVLIFLSIALPLARILDLRICFKRIFLNPKAVPTITANIDEECICTEIPGVNEGKFFWNAILRFA